MCMLRCTYTYIPYICATIDTQLYVYVCVIYITYYTHVTSGIQTMTTMHT